MILICVPYYNTPKEYFIPAVKSLLNQSYAGNYKILIVSDGCESAKKVFNDKRVLYYDMDKNRGRYFIDRVVSEASPYEFYIPSDSDDISSKDRLYYLMEKQTKSHSDAVFHYQTVQRIDGGVYHETYPNLLKHQTAVLNHVAHFSGLYKTEVIHRAGGFHPDYRCAYDTLFVNLVLLTSKVGIMPRLLYTRLIRPDSLTTSLDTGFGSQERFQSKNRITQLYRACYKHPDKVQELVTKNIKPETLKEVKKEVKKLKEAMSW